MAKQGSKPKPNTKRKVVRKGSKPKPDTTDDLGGIVLPGDERYIERAKSLGPDARRTIPSQLRRRGNDQRKEWVAPDDMPVWQAILVANGLMCGGRSAKRVAPDGGPVYCRGIPAGGRAGQEAEGRRLPYRCKHHGGMSPTEPNGNKRNLRHGLYTKSVLPDEEDHYESMLNGSEDVAKLDHEIAITKIRLSRAMYHERKAEEAIRDGKNPPLLLQKKKRRVATGGENGVETSVEVERNAPNWNYHINAIINQLTKLVQTRHACTQGTPEDAASLAAKVRQFAQEAEAICEAEIQTEAEDEAMEGDES